MSGRYVTLAATLAIGLSLAGMGPALSQHSHSQTADALQSMSLDNGRKWPTDEALRTGMSQIRTAVSDALPRIHSGQFGGSEYVALADTVQSRLDFIVTNCKLSEEADLQLHLALAQMLEGVATMRSAQTREEGAVAILGALAAYGDHFDHPGWTPLGH